MALPKYTVPSLTPQEGADVAAVLQQRLDALNDLALTLKHIHWNVVGPHFIAVHEMLDPQVDAVRLMVDAIAERIATLGVAPVGTPGALVEEPHLGRLLDRPGQRDRAPRRARRGLRRRHHGRTARRPTTSRRLDDVTNDLLIGHLHELELFHWFVRAHLESVGGALTTGSASTEKTSAKKAGAKDDA